MSCSVINLIIVFYFCLFVFYLLGIHNVLTRIDDNDCEMTYMFEYPQYVEISLPESVNKAHPHYALYGYSEGSSTKMLRKMEFRGIPVLFLPGSSGSYKQCRSLASVSLRKSLNTRSAVHFDYFVADFDGEATGLYGGVLEGQTRFVQACIDRILSLYRDRPTGLPPRPSSVILIGHSLGGLLAKAVFLDGAIDPQSVQVVLSLAAPHRLPVIQPDPFIPRLYSDVDRLWASLRASNLSHVSFASIGGGSRDLTVRSDLALDPYADVNVLSPAVPGVWCSTDHLSIVWCKQLVLAMVRAMFDMVDPDTSQITVNKTLRDLVLRYHLTRRSAGKRFSLTQHPATTALDTGDQWVEYLHRQFSVTEPRGVRSPVHIMVRLLNDEKHEAAFIETFNLNAKDWLFACVADVVRNHVRMCDRGENLSQLAQIGPTQKHRRKFAYVDMMDLKRRGYTHVVVRIPATQAYVQVNVDVHRKSDRDTVLPAPRLLSPSTHEVLGSTQDGALYHRVQLPGMEAVWHVYTVTVHVERCRAGAGHGVASLHVPWAHEDYHAFITNATSTSLTLRLTTPRPGDLDKTQHASVVLHLDPTCRHHVTLRSAPVAAAGQVARYYSTLLPGYMAAALLLALCKQLQRLHEGGCVLFHSALAESVRRCHVLVQAAIYGSKILGLSFFVHLLPLPDSVILHKLHLDFFFLSIFLFGIAVSIVYILGLVCYGAVIVSGQAAHKMALRFIARTLTGFVSWSEWVFVSLNQVPFIAATLLVSLALSTSGGLALCVGSVFYFLKVCKMYEDYLEDLLKFSIGLVARKIRGVARGKDEKEKEKEKKGEKEEEAGTAEGVKEEGQGEGEGSGAVARKEAEPRKPRPTSLAEVGNLPEIHFHVTVLLLWVLAALVHVPSVLFWARNYQHSVTLHRDPALVPAVVISSCGAFLWQSGLPALSRRMTAVSGTSLFVLAAVSIMYSALSMHRLGYVLTLAMVTLTGTLVISRMSPQPQP